ncbi:MAG: 16S rRNA (guanine(966)-N(2))-methyltransferase RsmD [Chthoniobacterales bacterium]|nr:16S rRNA (guanine(966)-N(2))-methyltransferase RsmD [Chthoniobacterales bacterium]
MRVIAGSAGGIRLSVPETDVRPTMDRVKAAIFSSLGAGMIGARVLDLFAGTGGLGIEALSRGAGSATFVEGNRTAALAIEQNFIRTKLRGRVWIKDVFAFLDSPRMDERYDFIFADPPYEKRKGGGEFSRLLLDHEKLPQLLEPGGIFVLEKRPAEQLISTGLWKIVRARTYGATEVLFLKRADAPDGIPVAQSVPAVRPPGVPPGESDAQQPPP